MLSLIYAECGKIGPYAECNYAECHYTECQGELECGQDTFIDESAPFGQI